MSNETKCPGHSRAECVSCCWPAKAIVIPDAIDAAIRDAIMTGSGAYEVFADDGGIQIKSVPDIRDQKFPFDEPATGYTAVDMTTAAAQGFRDGVESKKEALMFAAESLAKITSGDGSGHADLAFRTLALAGYKADEAKNLVDAWKKERSWR